MATIFTKIVAGEIPCHKVAETTDFLAFLDVNPVARGHTLVVPKQEVDYLFDLDATTYAGLLDFARRIVPAIEETVPCQRIGMSVIGLEVPHAHVHLIPLNQLSDMDFSKKIKMSEADLASLAAAIRQKINL